jgi:hypothetical protein
MAILIRFDSDENIITVSQLDTIEDARRKMRRQYGEVLRTWIQDEVVARPTCHITANEAAAYDGYEYSVTWEVTDSLTHRFGIA